MVPEANETDPNGAISMVLMVTSTPELVVMPMRLAHAADGYALTVKRPRGEAVTIPIAADGAFLGLLGEAIADAGGNGGGMNGHAEAEAPPAAPADGVAADGRVG